MQASKIIEKVRELEADPDRRESAKHVVAENYPALLEHAEALEAENRKLRLDNARLKRLPEQEWRDVRTTLEPVIATLVRTGHHEEARQAMQALEAGTTYVTRLLARIPQDQQ